MSVEHNDELLNEFINIVTDANRRKYTYVHWQNYPKKETVCKILKLLMFCKLYNFLLPKTCISIKNAITQFIQLEFYYADTNEWIEKFKECRRTIDKRSIIKIKKKDYEKVRSLDEKFSLIFRTPFYEPYEEGLLYRLIHRDIKTRLSLWLHENLTL